MSKITKGFKLALIQLLVGKVKSENLKRAAKKIKEAASAGASLVALPECFNSPYGTEYFKNYAERIPGESTDFLSNAAKENGIFILGGSIPELDCDKIYNTCTMWAPDGSLLTKYRKMHLFDINVPGGIVFKESSTLSPGSEFSIIDFGEYCKIGIGICYDMRFAELAQIYSNNGCKLLLYPGAFNMTTGPAHWELLQRARALDNQVYVATVSPARDDSASYVAWGHSSVVDPWGEVIATTNENEDIVYADIDLEKLAKIRTMIPLENQRRNDMYEVMENSCMQKGKL